MRTDTLAMLTPAAIRRDIPSSPKGTEIIAQGGTLGKFGFVGFVPVRDEQSTTRYVAPLQGAGIRTGDLPRVPPQAIYVPPFRGEESHARVAHRARWPHFQKTPAPNARCETPPPGPLSYWPKCPPASGPWSARPLLCVILKTSATIRSYAPMSRVPTIHQPPLIQHSDLLRLPALSVYREGQREKN